MHVFSSDAKESPHLVCQLTDSYLSFYNNSSSSWHLQSQVVKNATLDLHGSMQEGLQKQDCHGDGMPSIA